MITAVAKLHPEFKKEHCSECGAKTVTECPQCKKPITGKFVTSSRFPPTNQVDAPLPKHCDGCGAAFPWQVTKLESLLPLVDELDELSISEREQTKSDVTELAHDSPKAEVSAHRLKPLLKKLKGPAGEVFMKVLSSLLTDALKKFFGF